MNLTDMKAKYILILPALALLLAACQREADKGRGDAAGRELSFSSRIEDEQQMQTRTVDFDFFEEGDRIGVYITESNDPAEQKFTYSFDANTHVFTGNPAYYFPLDDNYIKQLRAIWPTQESRDEAFPYDQTESKNFRLADWMIAQPEHAIMPAAIPVLLNFHRENTKLHFELVGQNALGLDIIELTIELQVPQRDQSGNITGRTSAAFKAYCDGETGRAQIIAPAETRFLASEGAMICALKVTGDIYYTVVFEEGLDFEMKKGERYLITLAPKGYDMVAYVSRGEFYETGEIGTGIPFQKPKEADGGAYRVENPVQLLSLSYLVRHYTGSGTIDWPARTYIVSDNVGTAMTAEQAAEYIPIPKDLFTGRLLTEGGGDLEIIDYDGGELSVFEE